MQTDTDLRTEADRNNAIEAACGLIDRFICSEDTEIVMHAQGHAVALLEIMQEDAHVKNFAASRSLDLSSLTKGAFLILQNMHLNTDRNFYAVLGLPDNASHEEVHERWKRLISLYHPDRHKSDDKRFEEAARRVNEAFNTLKDPVRRAEHDRYLTELYLQKRFPDAAEAAAGANNVSSRHLHGGMKRAVFFAATALLIVGSVSLRISSKDRSSVVPAEHGSISSQADGIKTPGHGPDSSSSVPASEKKTMTVNAETGHDVHDSEGRTIEEKHSNGDILSVAANIRQDMARTEIDAAAQAPKITREDAAALLQKYAQAYSRNDLRSMMALFAMTASENDLSYREIHRKYSGIFTDRINLFNMDNIEMATEGQGTFARASYRIDSYMAKEDRWVKYSGRAVWKLVREDAILKIASINYE